VRLRCLVELTPGETRVGANCFSGWVDADGFHAREVDDKPVIARAMTCHPVTSTANGDKEAGVSTELDGALHVVHALTSSDDRRPPIEHAVENLAGDFVVRVRRQNQRASEILLEVGQR